MITLLYVLWFSFYWELYFSPKLDPHGPSNLFFLKSTSIGCPLFDRDNLWVFWNLWHFSKLFRRGHVTDWICHDVIIEQLGRHFFNKARPLMVILVFEISSNLRRWFFVGLFTDIVFFNGPLTTNSWTPDRTAALWSSIVLLGDKIKTDNSGQVFINTWKYEKVRYFSQFTSNWSMGEVECFSERNLDKNSWRVMWPSTFFRQEFCLKVFKLLFTNDLLQKQITRN